MLVDSVPPMFSVVPAALSNAPKVPAVLTANEPTFKFKPPSEAVPW